MNLHAKFDVSSSYRSRDMEGVPKISKVGHVTLPGPFLPNTLKQQISQKDDITLQHIAKMLLCSEVISSFL